MKSKQGIEIEKTVAECLEYLTSHRLLPWSIDVAEARARIRFHLRGDSRCSRLDDRARKEIESAVLTSWEREFRAAVL